MLVIGLSITLFGSVVICWVYHGAFKNEPPLKFRHL